MYGVFIKLLQKALITFLIIGKFIEELKQKKLAEMASKSIETIVPQMMAESGYEWNLESEYKYFGRGGSPDRYILRIKMKKHKMIEITLNQNNFANKIPEILNVVAQIEKLLEKVPYAVNVLNYGPNIRWIKGTEYVKSKNLTKIRYYTIINVNIG